MSPPLDRRRLLLAAAGSAAAAVVPAATGAEDEAATTAPRSDWPIIGFSKPFARLSFAETADLVADVGWDGIECPIRDGNASHIAPERVADDLPRMVEALAARGKTVAIVTTGFVRPDASGERILRTAAALGIRRVRLGFVRYPPDVHPARQLVEFRAMLRDVAGLAAELGIRLGYQNHSGAAFVGAPLWDLWESFRETDPRHVGVCFDIGHATIEGGLSWPVQARLLADRFVAVFCKDFHWERRRGGQTLRWCPWGEGAVDRSFFTWLRTSGFDGPLCQHHEYDLGDAPDMVAHFKRDLATLRSWLAA